MVADAFGLPDKEEIRAISRRRPVVQTWSSFDSPTGFLQLTEVSMYRPRSRVRSYRKHNANSNTTALDQTDAVSVGFGGSSRHLRSSGHADINRGPEPEPNRGLAGWPRQDGRASS
jgi:hypothetical protein